MGDYEAICFWCGNKFVYRCWGKSWVDADYSVCNECAESGNFIKIVNEATGNTPQKSKLPAEVINGFIEQGQQSCAASPWHYRTDTGDEHGKVVESAELPVGNEVRYLALVDSPHNRETIIYWSEGSWYIDCGTMDCKHGWLLKHLIAWAEIREES